MQRLGGADVGRLVVGKPALELVGVLEDLLQGAGHGHHLKYFLRAVIASTMTGTVVGVDEPEFDQAVGAGRANEHHESVVKVLVADRVVERVEESLSATPRLRTLARRRRSDS